MKINKFTLRTLTSLGVIIFLALIWLFLPIPGIPILVSAITLGLLWEYYNLIFFEKKISSLFTDSTIFLIFLSFIAYLFSVFSKETFNFVLMFTFFLVFGFWFLYKKKENILQRLGFSIVSLFYIVWPTALFLKVFLHEQKGTELLLLCLCTVLSGDIFAWAGGQLIGGKKWVPVISPGKTWVGLFCGLFASGLIFAIGFHFTQINYFELSGQTLMYPLCFLLGAFSFFIAQTGDLFVSLLKRKAGVKDSGCLLPGHGGILDRLDGFLLAFPYLYFSIKTLIPFY